MNYLFVLTIHTFRYGIVCIPKANGTANQMRIIKEFLVCISFAAVFSFFLLYSLGHLICVRTEKIQEREKKITHQPTIKRLNWLRIISLMQFHRNVWGEQVSEMFLCVQLLCCTAIIIIFNKWREIITCYCCCFVAAGIIVIVLVRLARAFNCFIRWKKRLNKNIVSM